MSSSKLYRLEIAPLVILPLGRSPFFSYLSHLPLACGSYVSISFGNRTIEGVVFDVAPLPGQAPHWMKFVGATIEDAFLTDEQRALAEYISDEYFTPLGRTLKHFLPKRTQSRKKKSASTPLAETLRATKEESLILKAFGSLTEKTPGALDTTATADPKRLFALLAKKVCGKKQQTLFLVPEIILLPGLEAVFAKYFPPEKFVVLHSQLSDGPYFEAWEKIRSGEAEIILATRQGLFAPFKKLGLVMLLEEQDESYKQWDMSPRYDGKRVAEYLALLHKAPLVLASGTPSIETRHHLKDGRYIPLTPLVCVPPLTNAFEIVNLRLERFRKNYSPLSQALIDAMGQTLREKKQILLYIHRQGMNAFSVCENCKNIFRCPESGHALTGNKDGTFRCLACGYKTGSFPSCSSCGHLSFRGIGFGTERIEREVMKLFPGARVFRADGSTMRTPGSAEKLHEAASQNRIDVLIGTQMILKDPGLPKLALIGMIDADSLLSFPDFRADEKLFHLLSRAVKQTSVSEGMPQKGKIVIQTFHPESTFFQRMANLDSEAFSQQILNEREDLYYPPFSRLISIVCQEKSAEATDASVHALYLALTELLPKGDRQYRLIAPQPAKSRPNQSVFESALLLRVPAGKPLDKNINLFLRKASASSIIDVDPLSFS